MASPGFVDFYALLQLDPAAGAEEIKAALQEQRRMWLPRASRAPTLDKRQEAERMVSLLDQAEDVLLNPRRRDDYDRLRKEAVNRPPVAPSPARRTAADWTADAWESLRQGRPELAVFEADQALHLDHHDSASHYVRGRALEALGETERALSCYRIAHELRPTDPGFQVAFGRALLLTGRHRQALEVFERAHTQQPDDTAVREGLAGALWRVAAELAGFQPGEECVSLGEGVPVGEIERLTRQALRLRPSDPEVRAGLLRLQRLTVARRRRPVDVGIVLAIAGSLLVIALAAVVASGGGRFMPIIATLALVALFALLGGTILVEGRRRDFGGEAPRPRTRRRRWRR